MTLFRSPSSAVFPKIKSQDLWRVTFKGKTITHNEKKMKWCDKHKFQDESVLESYMDMDHNHDA